MNTNQFIVVGDIHSNGVDFGQIVTKSREYNVPVILLGDLVDRGTSLDILIKHLRTLQEEGLIEAIVTGNHDHKQYRYLMGNKVKLSHGAQETAEYFDRNPDDAKFYKMLIEESYLVYVRGNHRFVHAAANKHHMREGTGSIRYADFIRRTVDRRGAEVYLYGYTTGETGPDGFPVRLMDWMDEVPEGVTVWKGHDYLYNQVTVNTNERGGKVVFMDTGSGHDGGVLSHLLHYPPP